MSQHTPGPWITKWNSGSIDVLRSYENGSFSSIPHAKVIDEFSCNRIRMRADANLIAAAPDLLVALEYAIKQVPELGTVPGIAAAIAKATGETK
jgi:hypothetical protein